VIAFVMRSNRRFRPGMSLPEVLVVLGIISILVGLLLPAVQGARESARRLQCSNHLRQVGTALENRLSLFAAYPSGTGGASSAKPFQGWMVELLPHLEQSPLFRESEQNFKSGSIYSEHPGFAQHLPFFVCPSDGRLDGPQRSIRFQLTAGMTSYIGLNGTHWQANDGILYYDSKVRGAAILDGKSNTIVVAERPPSPFFDYGWWYGAHGNDVRGTLDHTLGSRETSTSFFKVCEPPASAATMPRLDFRDECLVSYFWSFHEGGFWTLRADASVYFFRQNNSDVFQKLATRAGGEVVSE
jgi:prepilin-type N-terminal cleavage/methylation domain-containing protein